MATTSDRKLELKLLIEKTTQKVLFAEVRKDVVDFLFSLLSLPIGSLTKLITEESTFSTLCNMYRSFELLDPSKLPSTDPNTADNLLSFTGPATAKEYVFKLNCNCNKFTDVKPSATNSICESCGKSCSYMTLSYMGPSVMKKAVERDRYVKDGVTYFVMDDLSVVHLTPLETIVLLNKMGHKNLSLLEEKTVTLDVQQGLELLTTSFKSKNVLTDIFLAKDKEALAEDSDSENMGFSLFDY